jgi:hypothetical protein
MTTKTWQFSVAQKPVISGYGPTGTVNSRIQVITASATDNNSSINQSAITLSFDNRQVVPVISGSGGTVSISFATGELADDSEHTVTLTVSDDSGNSTSVSWKFYVTTKPDMLAVPSDCGTCHTLTPAIKYKHSVSPDAGLTGSGGTCGHCHKEGLIDKAICAYCHDGNPWDIYYGKAVPDPNIGANTDCLFCHGVGKQDFVQRKLIVTKPSAIISSWYTVSHNIPVVHKMTKGSCNDCHSVYLTREHNRATKNGVQITCSTCHNSGKPEVQNAIAAKNTDCLACHLQSGHDAAHNSNLNDECQTCHKGALNQEHINNFTTSGLNLTCNTCHLDTAAKEVKRTVSAGKLNCSGCHTEAHNMNLGDSVPPDIMLYNEFKWSLPLEALVFFGEPTVPAGYDLGQVVFSDRRTNLELSQVQTYFITQMENAGWSLVSTQQWPGLFNQHFIKGSRGAVIRAYNTVNSDGSGQMSIMGTRIEIWFK